MRIAAIVAVGFAVVTGLASSAELTAPLSLKEGETVHLGPILLTGEGGFAGYKRGADAKSESLMFVMVGGSGNDYAVLLVNRRIGEASTLRKGKIFGGALAYLMVGEKRKSFESRGWTAIDAMDPDKKWTADGVDYYYGSMRAPVTDKPLMVSDVYATIEDDIIEVEFQSPLSMSDKAFEGLRTFISAIRVKNRH